ncbi:hypothetical protein FB45DRAFT_1040453 [Roridomyces roridus]|uniref:Uncharacterized protein n=1 Tax=Roridomyces roridus TaxID=1738132 RepID=A0AAD7B1B2_9AGAR|nr:hypothetical protein FB45DRAFT_1040453 [Roridomyces roridus]
MSNGRQLRARPKTSGASEPVFVKNSRCKKKDADNDQPSKTTSKRKLKEVFVEIPPSPRKASRPKPRPAPHPNVSTDLLLRHPSFLHRGQPNSPLPRISTPTPEEVQTLDQEVGDLTIILGHDRREQDLDDLLGPDDDDMDDHLFDLEHAPIQLDLDEEHPLSEGEEHPPNEEERPRRKCRKTQQQVIAEGNDSDPSGSDCEESEKTKAILVGRRVPNPEDEEADNLRDQDNNEQQQQQQQQEEEEEGDVVSRKKRTKSKGKGKAQPKDKQNARPGKAGANGKGNEKEKEKVASPSPSDGEQDDEQDARPGPLNAACKAELKDLQSAFDEGIKAVAKKYGKSVHTLHKHLHLSTTSFRKPSGWNVFQPWYTAADGGANSAEGVPSDEWSRKVGEAWKAAKLEAKLGAKPSLEECFKAMPWLEEWNKTHKAAIIDFRVDQGAFPADINKVIDTTTKMGVSAYQTMGLHLNAMLLDPAHGHNRLIAGSQAVEVLQSRADLNWEKQMTLTSAKVTVIQDKLDKQGTIAEDEDLDQTKPEDKYPSMMVGLTGDKLRDKFRKYVQTRLVSYLRAIMKARGCEETEISKAQMRWTLTGWADLAYKYQLRLENYPDEVVAQFHKGDKAFSAPVLATVVGRMEKAQGCPAHKKDKSINVDLALRIVPWTQEEEEMLPEQQAEITVLKTKKKKTKSKKAKGKRSAAAGESDDESDQGEPKSKKPAKRKPDDDDDEESDEEQPQLKKAAKGKQPAKSSKPAVKRKRTPPPFDEDDLQPPASSSPVRPIGPGGFASRLQAHPLQNIAGSSRHPRMGFPPPPPQYYYPQQQYPDPRYNHYPGWHRPPPPPFGMDAYGGGGDYRDQQRPPFDPYGPQENWGEQYRRQQQARGYGEQRPQKNVKMTRFADAGEEEEPPKKKKRLDSAPAAKKTQLTHLPPRQERERLTGLAHQYMAEADEYETANGQRCRDGTPPPHKAREEHQYARLITDDQYTGPVEGWVSHQDPDDTSQIHDHVEIWVQGKWWELTSIVRNASFIPLPEEAKRWEHNVRELGLQLPSDYKLRAFDPDEQPELPPKMGKMGRVGNQPGEEEEEDEDED